MAGKRVRACIRGHYEVDNDDKQKENEEKKNDRKNHLSDQIMLQRWKSQGKMKSNFTCATELFFSHENPN